MFDTKVKFNSMRDRPEFEVVFNPVSEQFLLDCLQTLYVNNKDNEKLTKVVEDELLKRVQVIPVLIVKE